MKNFWGYIKNNHFSIGCTGQTVYIYDDAGNELSKFKDIKYAYTPMFCPKKKLLIVKSTTGMLAVYSLDNLELIKKFRFSRVNGSQNDGFCFSEDGKFFYNIERRIDSLKTRLSIYDTSNFECVKHLFNTDNMQVLSHIEYDYNRKAFFVLGFMRGKSAFDYGFIAELQNDELTNITKLSREKFKFLGAYKHLKLLGFTSKAKEWSALKYDGYDLTNIESLSAQLSDYIIF